MQHICFRVMWNQTVFNTHDEPIVFYVVQTQYTRHSASEGQPIWILIELKTILYALAMSTFRNSKRTEEDCRVCSQYIASIISLALSGKIRIRASMLDGNVYQYKLHDL